MRFGTIYCQNERILECIRRFHLLQPIAAPIENAVSLLVSDYGKTNRSCENWLAILFLAWLEKYFAENRLRLRMAFQHASKRLHEMGVSHTKAQGGFFTFLDVRKVRDRLDLPSSIETMQCNTFYCTIPQLPSFSFLKLKRLKKRDS